MQVSVRDTVLHGDRGGGKASNRHILAPTQSGRIGVPREGDRGDRGRRRGADAGMGSRCAAQAYRLNLDGGTNGTPQKAFRARLLCPVKEKKRRIALPF